MLWEEIEPGASMAKRKVGGIVLGVITLGISGGIALVVARLVSAWFQRRGV